MLTTSADLAVTDTASHVRPLDAAVRRIQRIHALSSREFDLSSSFWSGFI
jgi:hypothetical protein